MRISHIAVSMFFHWKYENMMQCDIKGRNFLKNDNFLFEK